METVEEFKDFLSCGCGLGIEVTNERIKESLIKIANHLNGEKLVKELNGEIASLIGEAIINKKPKEDIVKAVGRLIVLNGMSV